ncbi:MAG TPA: type II secretion system minor pseudopilin GspK [Rhodocyclaceae bacterium]|nr:type II secretion system minor pseudopilin GspK [Rhodocyclaceae bacterium]
MHNSRSNRGGAIIMAMLTVALVAGIATAIVADYGNAVSHLSGRHDQAQARWLARGAVDWARNVLEADYIRAGANKVDHLGEDWAIKVPPTPIEEGEVSGELEEQSGRFNLNSLVGSDGKVNAPQVRIFLRLLAALGYSSQQSKAIAAPIIDWIDSDDVPTGSAGAESGWYRSESKGSLPPQAPMLDLNELINVRGFDAALIERLRPHVTVLPFDETRINVNTASAEVLMAYIPNLTLSQTQVLVANRAHSFFTSIDNFSQQLPGKTELDDDRLVVTSTYFLATGRARWGDAVTRMQVLLRRDQARPDILWQKIL